MSHLDEDAPDFRGPDVVPVEPFQVGAGISNGGWCAPSEAVGEIPEVKVPRGGMQWPKPGDPVPTREQFAAYERARTLEATQRAKRHKERQGTIRVLGTLALVVLVLLAMMDALPWQ
jgi:hypothetical protein